MEDIAKRARVTTGAVFHHFKAKRDVMVAVFEQIENEIVYAMLARCAALDSPLERFSTGNRTFLEMCTARTVDEAVSSFERMVLGFAEPR